jgi:hypothetical protein
MRKIQDKFVPYQQSLEMKELGFDELGFAKYYQQDGSDGFIQIGETEIEEAESAGDDVTFECEAPLWQDAFEWFREKHNLEGQIKSWKVLDNIVWYISTENVGQPSRFKCYEVSVNTYKEAELECLKKLIEILRNK